MSRGFHAFFRQYYNLRALLRRVDPTLESLTAVPDYPLVAANGLRDSFARIPRTPPLNMAAFVAQSPSFRAADLAEIDVESVWELLDVDFPATFSEHDGESAAAFLDRLRFPDKARHLALEVFSRSFFARPEDFSAGELVGMFHTYFLGSSEGLLFDVPVDDYDTVLWAPLRDYLERLGVEVRTSERIESLDLDGDGVAVQTDDRAAARRHGRAGHRPAHHAAAGRRAAGSSIPDWRARIAETVNAPRFAVWRLWLDRRGEPRPTAFLGTSGYGPLDNITVLERFEAGARRWSAGARRFGRRGPRVRPAAPSRRSVGPGTLRTELARVYPETAAAAVVSEEWLVEDDCPAGRHHALAAPTRGRHSRRPARAGGRRDPLRLPGGPDGAGGDDRLPRRQPAAGPRGPGRVTTCGPCRPEPGTRSWSGLVR